MNTNSISNFHNIDTLQFSKRMQKAGLDKEVADELAEALRETPSSSTENFATKADLELIRKESKIDYNVIATKQDIAELKSDIAIFKSDITQDMALVKSDIAIFKSEIAIFKSDMAQDMTIVKNDIVLINSEIKTLRNDFRKDSELLRKDIIIKLGALMSIGIAIIATLIKL